MSEAQRIVALSRRARARSEQLCLATVVHVEGSSYRKPGARMLITSGGERAGTISGGCLESEVSRKAWWLTAHGPRVARYASFAEEDGSAPYGLGCGGTVSLLLEQAEPAAAVLAALEQVLATRQPAVVIMALGTGRQAPVGTVAILRLLPGAAEGRAGGSVERYEPVYLRADPLAITRPRCLARTADLAWDRRRSFYLNGDLLPCAGTHLDPEAAAEAPAYFVQYLAPPPALTLFGAGDDAQPVAELASALGWRVSIADGRAHLARRERFPQAAEVRVLHYADAAPGSVCGLWTASGSHGAGRAGPGAEGSAEDRTGDNGTLPAGEEIVVILTHSYAQDRALLTALLPRELLYLGILGPRHRTQRLIEEVAPRLGLPVEAALARLHSPVGLDLGTDDPATVALSIIAEIQAVLHGREVAIRRTLPGKGAEPFAAGPERANSVPAPVPV